jgi:beta-lactam-binding protein with PASTA domain
MNLIKYLLSKHFLKQVVIALILLVLALFFMYHWLLETTNHEQKIQVPNLSRMEISKVQTVLKELDLRYEVIDSASFTKRFPKKSVIEQNPKSGSFVKQNRKIYLTLNPSKYADISIIEFYGKTKNEVEAQLKSLGLVIGDYTYVKDLGKDVVRKLVHQGLEIKKGDVLPKNSIVDLVLGDGKGK